MPTLYVSYNPTTKVAAVKAAAAVDTGFTAIGSFVHPDVNYPDSAVIFHGVRDLLYKTSAKDPSKKAMFPENITNMDKIKIQSSVSVPVAYLTINPTYVALIVGDTRTVQATAYPESATNKAVKWTVDKPAVATVTANGSNSAVIKGLTSGDAVATATDASGNVTKTMQIQVRPISKS